MFHIPSLFSRALRDRLYYMGSSTNPIDEKLLVRKRLFEIIWIIEEIQRIVKLNT